MNVAILLSGFLLAFSSFIGLAIYQTMDHENTKPLNRFMLIICLGPIVWMFAPFDIFMVKFCKSENND